MYDESNTLARVPLHLQQKAQEIAKGGLAGQTHDEHDYSPEKALAAPTLASGVQGSYRTPHDRANGNVVFRRYADGSLDIDYAVDKVVEAIHITQETTHASVAPMDMAVLQALFPTVAAFGMMDPAMSAVYLKTAHQLLPAEASLVRQRVARHFMNEMGWNAGQGGHGVYSGKEVG